MAPVRSPLPFSRAGPGSPPTLPRDAAPSFGMNCPAAGPCGAEERVWGLPRLAPPGRLTLNPPFPSPTACPGAAHPSGLVGTSRRAKSLVDWGGTRLLAGFGFRTLLATGASRPGMPVSGNGRDKLEGHSLGGSRAPEPRHRARTGFLPAVPLPGGMQPVGTAVLSPERAIGSGLFAEGVKFGSLPRGLDCNVLTLGDNLLRAGAG